MPYGIGGEIGWFCPSISDSANDLSPSGSDGSYLGGMGTTADVSNGGTRAYLFDGVNDRVSVPGLLNTDGTGDFPLSITLWVKSNNNTKNCHFAGNYNDSNYGIAISQYMGTLYLGMQSRDGGYAALRRSVPSAFSNWTHIVMTYDGSSTADGIKVYLDGSLAASSAAAPAVSGSYVKLGVNDRPFTIGSQEYTYYFDGRIDDVRVFDRVISSTEVTDLYDGGSGRGHLSPAIIELGTATETNTSYDLAFPKITYLGTAIESDTANAIFPARPFDTGRVTESDSAFGVSISKSVSLGTATETDVTNSLTPTITVALGTATELEYVNGLSVARRLTLGKASETDTAVALSILGVTLVPLGMAVEANAAYTLLVRQGNVVSIGRATESDSVSGISIDASLGPWNIIFYNFLSG